MESVLMEALGVNRTVIRRAISHLQARGLVETRHDIGSFVLPPRIDSSIPLGNAPTIHEILSMLELRAAIETEYADLAAQRISAAEIGTLYLALGATEQDQAEGNDSTTSDLQFHLSIARATGNKHFVDTLTRLSKTLISRTRMGPAQVGYLNALELRAAVNHEHHSVFKAIARRDPKAARTTVRMHLLNSHGRLRRAHEAAGTQTTATGN